MSVTEDIQMRLLLDASGARPALASLRGDAVNLGGGLDRVTGSLDRLSGKATKDAAQALGALNGVLGSSATKSAEMLRGLDDLAGLLAGGGFLGIGLAAAGAGFAALTKYMDGVQKRADAMIALQLSGFSDLATQRTALESEVAKLDAQLGIGKKTPEQIIADFERRAGELRAEQQRRREEIERLVGVAGSSERRQNLAVEIGQLEQILNLESRRADRLVRLATEVAAAPPKAGGAGGSKRKGFSLDDITGSIQEQKPDAIKATVDLYEDLLAVRMGAIERERVLDQLRIADMEAAAERQRQIAESVAGYTTQAVGVGVSATQGLVDAMITGQEHALEHFAANVSRQAGSALIGHGINLAGAAVVSSLTGALPLAAAQGAGAAALIGSGIALGGVATGIEHTLAGGQIGRALPEERAARDPGVNRSRGGSSSSGPDGGPTNVYITYTAGVDPARMAKDLRRILEIGDRR